MKSPFVLALLSALMLSACVFTPGTPVASSATSVPTATPTPTPVLVPSAPTGIPPSASKGYALEFTQPLSSGLATLHVSVHTCSGIHGSWEGAFDIELTDASMHISGSGSMAFTLPPNEFTVRGEAPYSGSGASTNAACVITDVSGPLAFEIMFSPDDSTADVVMGSKELERLTVVCGDNPPVTIPFAIGWGPRPLSVPIVPYSGCP